MAVEYTPFDLHLPRIRPTADSSPVAPRRQVAQAQPRALDAAARTRYTVVDLRLPAGIVHAQAAALAERQRARGARHSMRVWREACQEALVGIARASSGLAEDVPCAAFYWEYDGDAYAISGTFEHSPQVVAH